MDKSSEIRNKVLYKNLIFNYGAKALYYLLSFLTVPLALRYLGNERYGIFQTILTFISWAMLANLGIGNGLRNRLSEFLGTGREVEVRGLVGAAFTISFVIFAVVFVVGVTFFGFIFDPEWLISNLTIPKNEVKTTFLVSFSFFSLNLLLSLFSSISFGIHKSYIATLTSSIHFLIYCVFLYFLLQSNYASNTIYVSYAYGIAMVGSSLFPIFSFRKNKMIWPPMLKGSRKYFKDLFTTSMGFFILQISSVIMFSSDNFILSKLLGPNEVTQYSIANKVFFLVISLFSIILIQVWNSTTDALARRDYNWIRSTVRKLNKVSLSFFLFSLFLSVFLNFIVKTWTGEDFVFSITFRFLFSLYVLIHCINAIYVNVLNGMSRLRIQTIAYISVAILNFALSYIFISKLNLGMIGVLYSKTICVFIITLLCNYDYRKFINKIESK